MDNLKSLLMNSGIGGGNAPQPAQLAQETISQPMQESGQASQENPSQGNYYDVNAQYDYIVKELMARGLSEEEAAVQADQLIQAELDKQSGHAVEENMPPQKTFGVYGRQ